MKVRSEPLQVECLHGLPWHILRRGKMGRIVRGEVEHVVDAQSYAGKWWLSGGLQCLARHYFLVEVRWHNGGDTAMEIFEEGGAWRLSRVSD